MNADPRLPAVAPAASPTLARVARGGLCAGCGACVALAPGRVRMREAGGFLRPVQQAPLAEGQEDAIAAVCPGLGLDLRHDAPLDHPLWGPVRTALRAHAADAALRHRASSGGVLSALLVHLLESGAVDFVVQIAADPARPVANRTVVSRSAAEVAAAAGSRYAPSAPLAGLDAVLTAAAAAGERGAFVGKPCDVAALRALARRDPRVDQVFPHVLSFFCAGVPSLRAAETLVARLGVERAELRAFRYRGEGWPGRATAIARDGRTASMSYAESWGEVLSGALQFRCKLCADGVGSFADVVCGDAWATDPRGYPLFDEAPGESLVLARTGQGAALVAKALAAGRIAGRPMAVEAITPMQPGQVRRKTMLAARLAALGLAARPRPRYRGLSVGAAARLGRPGALARNFLGTLYRLARRRG